MKETVIQQFFSENKIAADHTLYGAYSYMQELDRSSEIRIVKVILFADQFKLHVLVCLPFRISRSNHYSVFKELVLINDELEAHQCYNLDALSGSIHYHTVVDLPNSAPEIASIVEHSLRIVAEDSSTLAHMVCEEPITSEQFCEDPDIIKKLNTPEKAAIKEECPLTNRQIAFRNGQWNELGSENNTLSYSQLKQRLCASNNQVILMEGPSGCGKTMMLKEIQESGERRIVILSGEHIQAHLIHSITDEGQDCFQEAIKGCDVICIENIDWILRTKTVQIEAAFLINELSKKALVVLNGIDCLECNRILLSHIHQPLSKFQFLGETENTPENESSDNTYVSGKFIYRIQHDDTAMIVRYCGSETILEIPSELDGHHVTAVGKFSFSNCMFLQEVNCERMGRMNQNLDIFPNAFLKCSNLRMVFIDCDFINIQENAFRDCSDLHTLEIDSWACNIERFAFRGCSSLIYLKIDALPYAFRYDIFDGVLYNALDRWLLHAPDVTLLGKDYLNLPDGLLCIDDNAFEDCPNIAFLHIPESVIAIGKDAFKGCDHLKLLVYPESFAAKYAAINNIPFSYILKDDPSSEYRFE